VTRGSSERVTSPVSEEMVDEARDAWTTAVRKRQAEGYAMWEAGRLSVKEALEAARRHDPLAQENERLRMERDSARASVTENARKAEEWFRENERLRHRLTHIASGANDAERMVAIARAALNAGDPS